MFHASARDNHEYTERRRMARKIHDLEWQVMLMVAQGKRVEREDGEMSARVYFDTAAGIDAEIARLKAEFAQHVLTHA
jgi:hypothetical protein